MNATPVEAELARDGGGSACIDAECAAVIASKPGSHNLFSGNCGNSAHHRSHVGASLLAMAAGPPALMSTDPTLSRASPAPTVCSRVTAGTLLTTDPMWERA